jgi:hypothetical protein
VGGCHDRRHAVSSILSLLLCCLSWSPQKGLEPASQRFQKGLREGALIAGHTWVLLATEIRRHSDRGPQHFRIHRPNNVTAADMQEGSLVQVGASYARKGKTLHLLALV